MGRLSVTLDENLVEDARRLTHARTKREVIERALQELVQRQRLARLLELMGSDAVDMTEEELRQWRDESIRDLDFLHC